MGWRRSMVDAAIAAYQADPTGSKDRLRNPMTFLSDFASSVMRVALQPICFLRGFAKNGHVSGGRNS